VRTLALRLEEAAGETSLRAIEGGRASA